jgi:acyl-[acyl-carrier-protein]-phospholipid O-acyltransferase/long-chain-fatty-acid--[acyl-carrier-protein] ligase
VETALSTLYPDNALAVVSVPDAKKGEQLMLFIAGAEADRRQLAEFFKKQGISELAVPKYIQSVESIPLNGTGKIDYLKVKSEALKLIGV